MINFRDERYQHLFDKRVEKLKGAVLRNINEKLADVDAKLKQLIADVIGDKNSITDSRGNVVVISDDGTFSLTMAQTIFKHPDRPQDVLKSLYLICINLQLEASALKILKEYVDFLFDISLKFFKFIRENDLALFYPQYSVNCLSFIDSEESVCENHRNFYSDNKYSRILRLHTKRLNSKRSRLESSVDTILNVQYADKKFETLSYNTIQCICDLHHFFKGEVLFIKKSQAEKLLNIMYQEEADKIEEKALVGLTRLNKRQKTISKALSNVISCQK